MRAKNHKANLDVFAKLLIILSFFIFAIGFSYDSNFNAESKVKKDNGEKVQDEGPSVSITPNDGVDVVTNDSIDVVTNDSIESPVPSTENVEDNTPVVPNNNTENVTSSNSHSNNGNVVQQNVDSNNNLNDINNELRKEIEHTFNINVKYGTETENYIVANIATDPITNPSVINNSLIRLKNVLSLYPSGLFDEINAGGIPLTIYLVNNYSEENITGVTDSSYTYANISIAVKYPLEESFYHESYHYLERYMFKKGANFYTWNSINPEGFSYGTIYNDYSYSNNFLADAPFVNNYAQTDEKEDRASTFEYMMATSKASCLNNGQTVWKKAILMSRTIDAVFESVSPDVTEYWERFLY